MFVLTYAQFRRYVGVLRFYGPLTPPQTQILELYGPQTKILERVTKDEMRMFDRLFDG